MPSRQLFDEDAYRFLHPDVAAAISAGIVDSGWQHFALHGFAEGRQWVPQLNPLLGVSREIAPGDEMFFGNEDHYFDVGVSALHVIETALFAARMDRSVIKTVLDLPCGFGRVTRFLKQAFPQARLTACDLNREGVDFCAKAFGATPVMSDVEVGQIPPLGKYDLIWCGSLLTHLSEEKITAFIQLFQRSLQPNGILVFTSHGRRSAAELAEGKHQYGLNHQQIETLLASYRQRGFAYVDYSGQADYGISLIQPSFILAHIVENSTWQLLGYHETGWDKRQDVICLQKRA
ncbi:MAG: class I SAM-dependent methyltransferase [Lacunisphaera sp.]